jgi:predicted membrane metal-binding protein
MRYSAWSRRGNARVLRLPTWQIALLLAVAVAIGIAVAIIATGIFLIALPVAILVVIAYRLFGGRPRRTSPGNVIEGEFEVVDNGRARPSRDRR